MDIPNSNWILLVCLPMPLSKLVLSTSFTSAVSQTPKDISRLAPAGIIASMQPTHQTSDRTMAEARLGTKRLAGAYAWQTDVAKIVTGANANFLITPADEGPHG